MEDESRIHDILMSWAEMTRLGHRDNILEHHAEDALIFDVLPPMKYTGTTAYRASWDDWQPESAGEMVFALQDLSITVGDSVAFAHCFIQCGGVTPAGKSFQDLVRATFCLRKSAGEWRITHQHISKPWKN